MTRGDYRLSLAGALLTPPCPGPEALAELRECVDWVEEYERFELASSKPAR